MAQSLGQMYVHLVFGTTDHLPLLANAELRGDLHGYMTGIFRNLGCPSLRIGSGDDHVHALFRLSRVRSVSLVIDEVKISSRDWLHHRGLRDMDWEDAYGAFAVSPQNVNRVIRYIRNQEGYHRGKTFADEYHGLLQQCGGLYHQVNIHLVFSTKNRFPFLTDKPLRQVAHHRLKQICETLGCPALRVGGIEDHVHILCRLAPDQNVAQVVQKIKKTSTTWLATRHNLHSFDWQDGYGAFSVSPQDVQTVMRYIENQESHHQKHLNAHHQTPIRHQTLATPHRSIRSEPQSPG